MLSISAIVKKRKERIKWEMIRDKAEYHKEEVLQECDNAWKKGRKPENISSKTKKIKLERWLSKRTREQGERQ
jgi:hypothetical protein